VSRALLKKLLKLILIQICPGVIISTIYKR
jgi:hypothetical protein